MLRSPRFVCSSAGVSPVPSRAAAQAVGHGVGQAGADAATARSVDLRTDNCRLLCFDLLNL